MHLQISCLDTQTDKIPIKEFFAVFCFPTLQRMLPSRAEFPLLLLRVIILLVTTTLFFWLGVQTRNEPLCGLGSKCKVFQRNVTNQLWLWCRKLKTSLKIVSSSFIHDTDSMILDLQGLGNLVGDSSPKASYQRHSYWKKTYIVLYRFIDLAYNERSEPTAIHFTQPDKMSGSSRPLLCIFFLKKGSIGFH